MSNSITPYKKLTEGGRCKVILTLVMLMLLTLATSARALADDDRKAYAVFDNGTLTFYFDNQKATRTGAMNLNEGNTFPDWNNNTSDITTVVFSESFQYARPTSCYCWFYECTNLTEIKGIEYLNTSEVTNMRGMFDFCFALKSLDLRSFNTAKVTDMSGMFCYCIGLRSLDLSSFNTENVTNMDYIFYECSALKTILVGSGWNVDKVTSSDDLFTDCKNLTGGNGTPYQDDKTDKTYAVIDGKDGNHGYLTSLEQCTPYAVLEDNPGGATKTLVFRFGYKPDNAMRLNKDNTSPVWNQDASEITTVEFDPLFKYARPTTCFYWFYRCTNLTEIKGIQYLNTSVVTNMSSMFQSCSSLESLDLRSFNTANVTNMSSMFLLCSSLESLDLGSFNTEEVTSMSSMFQSCSSLQSLDLSSFNTESVAYMGSMFNNSSSLETLDLSSFNTENVTSMGYMFNLCSALKTILVGSGWNVDNVTYYNDMFSRCENLTGGNGTTYTDDKPTDKTYAVIDGKDGKLGYLSSLEQCTPYAVLEDNLGGKTKTLVFRFGYKPNNAMPLNEDYAAPAWNNNAPSITTVEFDPLFLYARPTTCYNWFSGCTNLTEIKGIEYLNTSEVTVMNQMFANCESIESLDLSSFNTAKVTNMFFMFAHCKALKSLDLSSFKTAKVTNMREMFYNCKALKSLDLSSFNTSEVTNMIEMFYNCKALKSLDLSSFNTSEVTNMSEMFYGCESLESLDLGSFNTAKVTNMSGMFRNCKAIKSLDLSSFNTSKVTNMSEMFSYCNALETILVGSGWNTENINRSIILFDYCENLTGGNGFHYEELIDNGFYAVIDGKDGNPGYLTLNALTLTNETGKTTAELNGDFDDGINAVLIINKEIKVDALTFNRKFTKKVTATVMFPFGFTAGNNIKGTFHTIAKVGPDKNGVWTAELSAPITDIKANTPYIFYPSEDITSITFNNITLVPTNGTLSNGDDNGWQLHGVYSKKIWEENSKTEYGFAAEKVEEDGIEAGEFVLAGKDAWADPMRCYLTYAGSGTPFTAKAATVLPDRIRVVFPSDNDNEITTDPAEVITPVSSVSETSDIKVWSFGGTIYIKAQPNMDYTIIDLSGRTIKKGVTRSTREEVSLNAKGIVIVRIANKSFKIN